MTRRRIPRLRCPVCDGAPRLPADLRRELRCQSGARLRVALVLARPPTCGTGGRTDTPLGGPPMTDGGRRAWLKLPAADADRH